MAMEEEEGEAAGVVATSREEEESWERGGQRERQKGERKRVKGCLE